MLRSAPGLALGVAIGAMILGSTTLARAERVIAVVPLATLGSADTSASTRKVASQIEAAVGKLAGTKVVTSAQVAEAIKKAKKAQLKACDFEASCLAEIGRLVGAEIVIAGEVGGLGEAKVIYLGATSVATAKELRSTTLTLGASDTGGGPSGAVTRLLEPERYRGTLQFVLDVKGATVYVNGAKTPLAAQGDASLPVGRHAVRVTHPEYHDFVRFIDVPFGTRVEVPIAMTQYPILQRDIQGKPTSSDTIIYDDPPLWRRWYVVGPAAVGLAIVTGLIVGYAVHDFPDGECRMVGGDKC